MYSLNIHNKISEVKNIWIEFQNSNMILSPFQYYDYNEHIYRQIKTFSLFSKKAIFAVLYKENKPIAIAPIIINKSSNLITLLQDISGSGSADFIYESSCKSEDLCELLSLIAITYKYKFLFQGIPSYSPLFEALTLYQKTYNIKQNSLVNIHFGNDPEMYFKSLSKNSRQNIRTAINRLNTKSYNLDFKIIDSTIPCKKSIIRQIFNLYYKRRISKYGNKKIKSIISSKLASQFKHDSQSLKKSENRFYSYITINGEIAAVLLGFVNISHTSLYVPRLAINEDFYFYSPGIILINKTIAYLIQNSSIRNLDLTKGDEKYKFQMGGEIYHTYTISF